MTLTATPTSQESHIQLPTPWMRYSLNQESNPATLAASHKCGIQDLPTPSSNQKESNENLLTIKGETHINEIALSPSGSFLALAEDFGLSMVSANTFEQIWFRQTMHKISHVSFSPAGQLLVTGLSDGSIILWDQTTGDQLQVLSGHETHVSATFSADGCKLASISDDGVMKLWDMMSGKNILTITLNDPFLEVIAHSPEGLLHAVDTNFAGIWNTKNMLEIHHQDMDHVVTLDLSPDNSILALGTIPITLWDTHTGEMLYRLDEVQYSYVTEMVFAHDGGTVAFGTLNGAVYLYHIEYNSYERILPTERGDLTGLAFSQNGTILYAAYAPILLSYQSEGGWLVAWDIMAGKELRSTEFQFSPPLRYSLSSQGAMITSFVDKEGPTLETWEASTRSGSYTLVESINLEAWECVPSNIHATMSKDGKRLATLGSSCDDGIVIWDLNSEEVIQLLPRPSTDDIYLALSPDGTILITNDGPTDLAIWDVEHGQKLHSLPNIIVDSYLTTIFSADEVTIAISDLYGDVHIYSIESGKKLHTLHGQKNPGVQIAFSPDGHRLATGGRDSRFMIWDVETGEQINQGYQNNYVLDIAFSPDGSILVTSTHGKILFWDTMTLEPLGMMEGHIGKVSLLGFSPDGTLMLTKGMDDTMILWNIERVLSQKN